MGGSTGLHFAFLMKHELPRHRVVIDHPLPLEQTTPPGPGSPRTCRQPARVGGHARPTCAPSLTRSFTYCELVASGACYPASSRARAPFTITHACKDAG